MTMTGRQAMPKPSRKPMGADVFGHVVEQCLGVSAGEQVVLITDDGTDERVVAGLFESVAVHDGIPILARMPTPRLPGAEPPGAVAATMRAADAVIELTSLFIGSSQARRRATERGVRYLAMPGVRTETFRQGGPLDVDFERLRADAERVGTAWSSARTFRLTSRGGTDLRGSVDGRPGRVLHGMAREPGSYTAPPDIESGTESVRLTRMLERCGDEQMMNLAEVSLAFNPAGTVCSVPMETESARGTAHVALGNSVAYGGIVDAVAHLDCVMRDATLELDGREVMVEGTVS